VNAPAGVTFTQLTAGSWHTCGLGSDTQAYCWGNGSYGQLGNGNTADQSSPAAVNAAAGVTFTHSVSAMRR
jgi:alpha-tubulin suppressor-like RCC1 family protein